MTLKIKTLKDGNPVALDWNMGSLFAPVGSIFEFHNYDPTNSRHVDTLRLNVEELKTIEVISITD